MALRGLWRVRARPIPHPTSFGSAAATANATACAEKTRAGGEGGNAENNINAPQTLILGSRARQPLRRKRGQAGHGLGATLDTLPRGAGIAQGDSSKRSKRRPPASCRACGYDVRRTSNGVTDMLRSVLTLPRPSFCLLLALGGSRMTRYRHLASLSCF